jgi:hypothetical protein
MLSAPRAASARDTLEALAALVNPDRAGAQHFVESERRYRQFTVERRIEGEGIDHGSTPE